MFGFDLGDYMHQQEPSQVSYPAVAPGLSGYIPPPAPTPPPGIVTPPAPPAPTPISPEVMAIVQRIFGGAGGDKGAFGEGNAATAQGFADRNMAVNPDLGGAISMGASMGPLGAFGLMAGAAGLNPLGNPFNVAGPSLTPEQHYALANMFAGMPEHIPAVVKANMLTSKLADMRSQDQARASIGGIVGAGQIAGGDTRADPGAPGGGFAGGGQGGGGLAGGARVGA